MRFFLFILFGCTTATGFSQDLRADIAAMNAHLEQLPDYRISVAYAAGDTADFFDQGAASVIVSGDGYFYQTDFASMIINQQHTIIVNEEERTLIWSDNTEAPKKKRGSMPGNSILQGIDTLIASADSVYFSLNGTERHYYLRFQHSYFDLVELTFQGLYLTQVVYHYNETVAEASGVTAICKVQVEEHPVYDKQLLTSGFYFNTAHGTAVPTEPFTGYVLIYNESVASSIE